MVVSCICVAGRDISIVIYHITQIFGRIGTARKLVEKTLAVGRGKAHSIVELTRSHNFLANGNEPPNLPKFCAIRYVHVTRPTT